MTRKVYFQKEKNISKIAVMENGVLFRYFEIDKNSLVGNVYRGKVEKVTTDGAFVNFGEDVGFLSPCDKKVGDYLTVQVDRDAIGAKKVRLKDKISLAGRYVVVLQNRVVRFSNKLTDREKWSEREKEKGRSFGVLFRSACVNGTEEEVFSELERLDGELSAILERGNNLYKATDLYRATPERTAAALSIDGEIYPFSEEIKKMTQATLDRVVEREGVEIVFDKTEAMTVVDVNNKRNFGKTEGKIILRAVDLDAADLIAEQIRLRDIGGLIAVDFINIEKDSFAAVKERFDAALSNDYVKASAEYCDESCVAIVTRKKSF